MSETVSVSVSGAAFSLLLYENIKSEHDQDGFLLGSIVCKETNKLTDADHRVVNRERTTKVTSVIPCPQQFYFYDASGKINADKITNLLSSQEESVVGWYIFKRKRVASKFTLREKIVHKQLAKFFCPQISYFSCCLLTSNNSEIRPTYSLSQTFVRYHMSKYENLPLHINNLSDPSYTFKTAEPVSDLLNKVVKSVKSTGETEGHLIVKKVQDSLQQHMKKLVTELTEKEQQLFKFEQEVKQLQRNLKLKREFGTEEKETDYGSLETEVVENGTPENESSLQSTQSNIIENSPDNQKKRRGRPRKPVTSVQNSPTVSPEKSSDIVGDHLNENETITPRLTKTRPKSHNISYSEMAQKKKN